MKVAQHRHDTRNLRAHRKHALVIGGSMAGMLAARVLAEHFERVTLLERDAYPEGKEHRRGQPQSHHLHALLARGLEIIEELFPAIRDELIADGAIELDSGSDLLWHTPSGLGKSFSSGITFLSFSRPFLDMHIRRRLAELSNVNILCRREVTRLLANADRDGVRGVSMLLHESDSFDPNNRSEESIEADLIVDASGRHSCAPRWL